MHKYSDVFRRVAPHLAKLTGGYKALKLIASYELNYGPYDRDCMEFELAEALYWLSCDWHSGQKDPLYAIAHATKFKPGLCVKWINEDDSDALDLYNGLAMALGLMQENGFPA